ncbi:MAG: helix-turn-helix transcriptional regulator [Ancalomicrobiaceae bacterium]|nr:helix-turn-helix transcriptional regulator [Ancalomicrobiaceae bacterium]
MWIHPDEHKVVGEVLADFRKQRGLRQQDLAGLLGKPQSFVSSYEAGQRRIDILELLRIASALGTAPNEIFTEIIHRASH